MVHAFQSLIKKETRTFFDHILNDACIYIYTDVCTHTPQQYHAELAGQHFARASEVCYWQFSGIHY